jgi:plastocyanin
VTVIPNDQGTGFSPASVSLKVGDIVEWSVTGTVPHNVMFTEDPNVSIDLLQHGDTWQVRFTRPGTYHYHCTFHGESGTVTVRP